MLRYIFLIIRLEEEEKKYIYIYINYYINYQLLSIRISINLYFN